MRVVMREVMVVVTVAVRWWLCAPLLPACRLWWRWRRLLPSAYDGAALRLRRAALHDASPVLARLIQAHCRSRHAKARAVRAFVLFGITLFKLFQTLIARLAM